MMLLEEMFLWICSMIALPIGVDAVLVDVCCILLLSMPKGFCLSRGLDRTGGKNLLLSLFVIEGLLFSSLLRIPDIIGEDEVDVFRLDVVGADCCCCCCCCEDEDLFGSFCLC